MEYRYYKLMLKGVTMEPSACTWPTTGNPMGIIAITENKCFKEMVLYDCDPDSFHKTIENQHWLSPSYKLFLLIG